MGQPWIAPDTPAEPRAALRTLVASRTESPDPPRGPLRDSPVGRLAPRTITSILDAGFEVVRYRFTTIATLSAVIVLPLSAIPTMVSVSRVTDALDEGSRVPAASLGIGFTSNSQTALSVLSALGSSMALALLGVGMGHLVAGWLTGRDPTAVETLRFVGRRSGVAIVAWFVALLIKALSLAACGIGIILTVPMFVVLSPIVAVEGAGPLASVRRSWRLSSRRRAGTMIALVFFSGLVTLAFQLIIAALGAVIESQVTGNASWSWILLGVISVGFNLVLAPVQAAWAALAYLDLRVRSEGMDLELEATDVFDRVR